MKVVGDPPGGRLKRAPASGDPLIAITAAADVEHLLQDDTLALGVLLLRAGVARGSRAAARVAGRFTLEQRRVNHGELGLLLAGLDRLRLADGPPLALRLLLDRRRMRGALEQLDRH